MAVVERGPLRGREQEWNISRKELNELVSTWHRLTASMLDAVDHCRYHTPLLALALANGVSGPLTAQAVASSTALTLASESVLKEGHVLQR